MIDLFRLVSVSLSGCFDYNKVLVRNQIDKENLSAKQPQAREEPWLQAENAHSCRQGNSLCSPPQRPFRAQRLTEMIPRAYRLRDSQEFRSVSRTGIKYRTPSLVVSARPSPNTLNRFGFVVPKRVGNAVTRNLVKRRLRSACSGFVDTPFGLDFVLRAEKPILELSFQQLQKEVGEAFETLRKRSK